MTKLIVLIPAYRPADALPALCQTLTSRGFTVVCVDDGSGSSFDSVFDEAAQYAEVLRYPDNRGKGGALKYGIDYIARTYPSDDCAIVTADADGQHTPDDIARVAEAVRENGGLVIGSRQFTGKVPARSRFGNSITRLVFRIASGKEIGDTQTGLRAFPMEYAPLFSHAAGEKYEYEMNVLFAAVENKIPVTEIPIETVYEDGNKSSHFHPIRDSARIYRAIFLASKSLKYLFSSVAAFVIDYILLLLLDAVLPFEASMEVAAPIAWVVSSLTNFALNRNFVFRSNTPLLPALGEYYGLAGAVFLLKTYVLLELLTRLLRLPLSVAKLIAEVVFFVSNYFIQKNFIFKKKEHNKPDKI